MMETVTDNSLPWLGTARLMRKTYLCVCAVCLLGIGTFLDFDISMAVMGETALGSVIADFGLSFVDLLYAVAGTCLYKGFRCKGERYDLLARVLLVVGLSMPFIFYADGAGWDVRYLMGYVGGTSSPALALVSLLPAVLVIAAIPLSLGPLLDDRNPDRLIAVGALLIMSGICAQYTNDFLKPLVSRPRPRYLVTLEDPASEYRPWWWAIPYVDGPSDAVGSWPSNHMMLSALMLNLPVAVGVVRHRSKALDLASVGIACAYVAVMAINRIQMGGHFLSDVCSGTLITTCLLMLFDAAFLGWRKVSDDVGTSPGLEP